MAAQGNVGSECLPAPSIVTRRPETEVITVTGAEQQRLAKASFWIMPGWWGSGSGLASWPSDRPYAGAGDPLRKVESGSRSDLKPYGRTHRIVAVRRWRRDGHGSGPAGTNCGAQKKLLDEVSGISRWDAET